MASGNQKPVVVRQVFAANLRREFECIRDAVTCFRFASIDTEFPGTIFKQDKQSVQQANPLVNYQYMKDNVNELKIIQLGLTLSDSEGNLPDFGTQFCYIWEFNFSDFDVSRDFCDKKSIELLQQQGIDFLKNKKMGIDSGVFAWMIWHSGLFNYFRGMTWITFHGSYDFGYLVKILTQRPLPCNLESFKDALVNLFGYQIFDIKHAFRFFGMHGGLEKVAQILNVARIAGSSHQAGSDSLLTLQCFTELKKWNAFKGNRCIPHRILPPLALYGLVSASTCTVSTGSHIRVTNFQNFPLQVFPGFS